MPTKHVSPDSADLLQEIAGALLKSRKVVVVTGAGISTNSGIPDFRSENGLYSLIQAQFEAAAKLDGDGSDSDQDASVLSERSDDSRPAKRRKVTDGSEIKVDTGMQSLAPLEQVSTSPIAGSTRTSRACSPVAQPDPDSRDTKPELGDESMISITCASPLPPGTPCLAPRFTGVTDQSHMPFCSSPLSSPPPILFDPYETSQGESAPSSSASASDTDEDASSTDPFASQSSSTSRRSLPNMKGRDLFDVSIWADPMKTSVFYTFATTLRQKVRDVRPTNSHHFISHLRDRGKLVRCYTQNIDEIEEKVGLSTSLVLGPGHRGRFSTRSGSRASVGTDTKATQPDQPDQPDQPPKPPVTVRDTRNPGVECVFLHGSLHALRCFMCGETCDWDEGTRERETLSGRQPSCPRCEGATAARQERGKRALGVGKLRPDIVLYGEEHPNAHLISPIVQHDLSLAPDMMLILGTSLRVHGLKVLVKEFARAIHRRGGKVVFVNFTKPPESVWADVIDYWVEWDCDAWVQDLKERQPALWLPPDQCPPAPERRPKLKARRATDGPQLAAVAEIAVAQEEGQQQQQEEEIVVVQQQDDQQRSDQQQSDQKNDQQPNGELLTLVPPPLPPRFKPGAKRPMSVRDDHANGAFLVCKIMAGLARFAAEPRPEPPKRITSAPPRLAARAARRKPRQSAPAALEMQQQSLSLAVTVAEDAIAVSRAAEEAVSSTLEAVVVTVAADEPMVEAQQAPDAEVAEEVKEGVVEAQQQPDATPPGEPLVKHHLQPSDVASPKEPLVEAQQPALESASILDAVKSHPRKRKRKMIYDSDPAAQQTRRRPPPASKSKRPPVEAEAVPPAPSEPPAELPTAPLTELPIEPPTEPPTATPTTEKEKTPPPAEPPQPKKKRQRKPKSSLRVEVMASSSATPGAEAAAVVPPAPVEPPSEPPTTAPTTGMEVPPAPVPAEQPPQPKKKRQRKPKSSLSVEVIATNVAPSDITVPITPAPMTGTEKENHTAWHATDKLIASLSRQTTPIAMYTPMATSLPAPVPARPAAQPHFFHHRFLPSPSSPPTSSSPSSSAGPTAFPNRPAPAAVEPSQPPLQAVSPNPRFGYAATQQQQHQHSRHHLPYSHPHPLLAPRPAPNPFYMMANPFLSHFPAASQQHQQQQQQTHSPPVDHGAVQQPPPPPQQQQQQQQQTHDWSPTTQLIGEAERATEEAALTLSLLRNMSPAPAAAATARA